MMARCVLLAVFLIVAWSSGSVEANWFTDQWESAQEKFGDWKEKLSGYFDAAATSLKKRFGSLNENLMNMINKKSFTNASAEQLIAWMPIDGWNEMQPAMLMTAKGTEVTKLLKSVGPQKLPQRLLNELSRLVLLNMTDQELIAKIKETAKQCKAQIADNFMTSNNNCKMTEIEWVSVVARLGVPKLWSAANITSLGPSLFYLPICLTKIKDEDAVNAVMQEITNCQVNSPDPLCPDSKTMNEIKESFNLKTKFPPINEWTDSDLAQFGGVPMAPVSLVPYFNDQLIKKAKPDIIKIKFDANNYLQCLVWAQALCRVDNCDEMDKETAITWYNSLDGIETCITPSFFDPVVLADDSLTTEGSLKAKLFATVKSMGKMMMARDSYAVQKTVFEGVTGANVTKDVIDGLGGDHMARASACMLQGAAKRTLLKTVLPLMSGSISMAQGSEFPAKVAALMEANMQSALNGNTFTYSNINEALRPYISPKYIRDQSVNNLEQITKLADEAGTPMTSYQIYVVLAKLAVVELKNFPVFLRDYAPTVLLNGANVGDLNSIAKDMSLFSLPCLTGAKKSFGTKYELTGKDLTEGKEFLKCMSAEDAKKVKLDMLVDALKNITETKMPLSNGAVRVFRNMLVKWADTNLPSSASEALSGVYLGDIAVLPPSVIADAGDLVLSYMTQEMKTLFMMRMCKMDSLTHISQIRRRMLINSIVKEMLEEDDIDLCMLKKLGTCGLDLETENIKKLDEAASLLYLNTLEKKLEANKPVCLDKTQKDVIGEKIVEFKGPTKTWKDANQFKCLMDTLSDTKMNGLNSEVLATVSCNPNISPFDDGQVGLCRTSAKLSYEAVTDIQARECMMMRGEAACDVLGCGGVRVMTEEEVKKLTPKEILDNLEAIGSHNMNSNIAKALLDKLKEEYELSGLSNAQLSNMGYMLKGLSVADVEKLLKFSNSGFKDFLYKLGMGEMVFPKDVALALVNKVITDYKATDKLVAEDIVLLGHLMCYFTDNQLTPIPNAEFLKAMRYLGTLRCSTNTQANARGLAKKAVAAYISDNRKVSDWDAATLAELNTLIGGLEVDKVMDIPSSAFNGLTPTAMSTITTDVIPILKVAQVMNIQPLTAAAMTGEQINKLDVKAQEVLKDLLPSSPIKRGSAPGVTLCLSLALLPVLVVMV